ncbi:hypothetical protein JCM16303_005437 [Sporobolomyces ruberrimus]
MRRLLGVTLTALLALRVCADNKVFYASAVSYCSDSRAIEVEKFLLEYDDTDKSISFDISAASVEPNLNAILNLELIAYGINAVNTTLNLCELLSGVLCPLPQYDFVGSATIPLPNSVTDSINIPGIGFLIPDLQATAFVRLLRVGDNSEAACLRVDLSNGKTVRWSSVSWALGGLAIGSVLLSILFFLVGTLVYPPATAALTSLAHGSLSPAVWASLARRKERLLLLTNLLQFAATTGILSLDYPIIYDSYTANFAFALGLIRETPIQAGIDSLRNGTGGNLTRLAGSRNLVGGTDATRGIFNRNTKRTVIVPSEVPSMEEVTTAVFEKIAQGLSKGSGVFGVAKRFVKRQSTEPSSAIAIPAVQQQDTINAVNYGIPHALVNLDMSPYNAFMTVFINFLFLMAIVLALALIGGIFWVLLTSIAKRKANKRSRELGQTSAYVGEEEKQGWKGVGWKGLGRRGSGPFMSVLRAGSLRLLLVAWYPLALFTFYQWTIGMRDSYAPVVLSVFTIVCIGIALVLLSLRFVQLARRAWRYNSSTPPASSDTIEAGPHAELHSSPFKPAPTNSFTTPNVGKALPKAQRREVEDLAVGELLSVGGASYAPFWNAYKCRSRKTTAGRKSQWKGRGWWFGLIELVLVPFVTALFVAFAHASGWTQTIALLVIQSLLFLALCIWTPYEDKSSNATHIFLAIWRVVVAGALIVFNESIGLNEIVRVAVGAVLAVIISVLVILFFILLVIDFVQLIVFLVRGIKLRRRTARAGTNPDNVDYNPVGPPPMSAQMREKPQERQIADSDGDDSSRDSPAVDRPYTRSSMTLASDHPEGLGFKNGPPPVTGSHFNERL